MRWAGEVLPVRPAGSVVSGDALEGFMDGTGGRGEPPLEHGASQRCEVLLLAPAAGE